MTGSGALLGAVLGVRVIPLLLLAPLSGVAADRFNRRRLMQVSQALALGYRPCWIRKGQGDATWRMRIEALSVPAVQLEQAVLL